MSVSTRVAQFIRANLMGIVALYVALGGVALASHHRAAMAPKNSVVSRSIKDGKVKRPDLGKAAVSGRAVKDGSLKAADVAADSLTGQQVDESTLGAVPRAASAADADDADQLGGQDAAAFQQRVTGSCSSGQSVQSVNADGSVGCGANGGPPSGAAGGDLAGSYPDPALAAGSVAGGTNGVVEDNSLTGADVLESALDNSVLQFRGATTSCPANQAATALSAAGNLDCQAFGSGDGTITGVTAGTGLTGGGTSGGVTINANTDVLQSRVSSACGANQAIRAIAGDGTVTCESSIAGSPTGNAGGDLSGSYPSPSIANGAITGGAGGKIVDNTLTGADVDESSLAFPGLIQPLQGGGFTSGTTISSTEWTFVGSPVTVTTAGGNRITATADVPVWTSGSTEGMLWDICYQASAGGTVNNASGLNYQDGQVTTNHLGYAAMGTFVPGAGTWKVGYCVEAESTSYDLFTDLVNGWVMLTR